MDPERKGRSANPFDTTNPISRLFFFWIIPLLRRGMSRELTPNDLYNVRREDGAKASANEFETKWKAEVLKCKESGKTPQIYRVLISIYGKTYACYSFLILLIECILKVAEPILLRLFIKSFGEDGVSPALQYSYAAGVCLTSFFHTLIVHTINFRLYCMAMKYRVAISSLIYRKALSISRAGQSQTTLGHIINLLGNDVYGFDTVLLFIPYIIIGPIQLALLTYILWAELGPSSFAGIGFVLLLTPLQYLVGKYSAAFRLEISKRTDTRARFMNEIITGIRVIKMYAWEKPFSSMIHRLRSLEVKALTKLAYLQALYMGLYYSAVKPMILLTIVMYIFTGNQMTPDKIFFAVATFNTVLYTMLFTITTGAAALGSCLTTCNRIGGYLTLEDQLLSDKLIVRGLSTGEGRASESGILMKGVNASWTQSKQTLRNLNLDISGNKLVMVIGAVGSGKSSFLNALIRELPLSSGECVISGTSSYAAQDAWIFPGTIRDNILFGRQCDEQEYDEVTEVCGLKEDLRQLDHGDLTLVGERGVSLSGGQKARVNLARALYKHADILLLDDPLSAVDTRVSRHIFEKCVKKYLRTHLRVLVTHQVQYLPKADYIVVLHEGSIIAQGTYKDLSAQEVDFMSILRGDNEEDVDRKASTISLAASKEVVTRKDPAAVASPQLQEEFMASGSVSVKAYLDYFKSSKAPCTTILLLIGFILSQAIMSFTDYWLSFWTNQEELRIKSFNEQINLTLHEHFQTSFEDGMNLNYLWIFCGLVGAVIFSVLITIIGFYKYSMKIGVNIHDNMFQSLVRSPTLFFDENPSGRIMNRVTKDLSLIDVQLPEVNYDTISIFLQLIGIVTVVVISNYYILAPTTVVLLGFYITRCYYVSTARALRRMDALSRSPLFTHLVSSYQGLATIRSSNSQAMLAKEFESYQDSNTAAYFLSLAATRWFAIWLEMITIIYLSLITFSFLVLTTSTMSGDVGLAISSVIILNLNFQWGMRQSAEQENIMTSVERILEYTAIKPEAELESSKSLPVNWISTGEIRFETVSLAYNEKDVLTDLNFTIRGREKIGIVGRTGAGKSSLITALFRLTEPRGSIYIDKVRVNDIGLHDLRKNISIIPQDPVLFSGSMRYNLDPFDQFQDRELWAVLEEVLLKDAVSSLDFEVADGGANFSVGERQLVCLARAILRNNSIVILDEATANVDMKTDTFIQNTIRTKFSNCTILTIAHRLNSVMDCDRILVLDHGQVKEYDHPYNLLQDKDGFLSAMINQMGKAEKNHLHAMAAQNFSNRSLTTETGAREISH